MWGSAYAEDILCYFQLALKCKVLPPHNSVPAHVVNGTGQEMLNALLS